MRSTVYHLHDAPVVGVSVDADTEASVWVDTLTVHADGPDGDDVVTALGARHKTVVRYAHRVFLVALVR